MVVQGISGLFAERKARDLFAERDQCIGKPVRLARHAVRRIRRKFFCKESDFDSTAFFLTAFKKSKTS
jgi:hypothetical protein